MTAEERGVIEAARVAARFLPPPSFVRGSPGYKATKALCAAVKAMDLSRRRANEVKP